MTTATIRVSSDDINEHVQNNGHIKVNNINIETTSLSFDWSNRHHDEVTLDYDLRMDDDLEYDIDIEDIEEYCELVENNDELLAKNDELIKENTALRAELDKLKEDYLKLSGSFWHTLFKK